MNRSIEPMHGHQPHERVNSYKISLKNKISHAINWLNCRTIRFNWGWNCLMVYRKSPLIIYVINMTEFKIRMREKFHRFHLKIWRLYWPWRQCFACLFVCYFSSVLCLCNTENIMHFVKCSELTNGLQIRCDLIPKINAKCKTTFNYYSHLFINRHTHNLKIRLMHDHIKIIKWLA